MDLRLTPELERFVDRKVKSGQFASASEVVEAGLARLMLDPVPEELDADTLAAIDRAEGEFDRGEGRGAPSAASSRLRAAASSLRA